MSTPRRAGGLVTMLAGAISLVTASGLGAPTAVAAPVVPAVAPCVNPVQDTPTPRWREVDDTPVFSGATKATLQEEIEQAGRQARSGALTLPRAVVVPVYVHVIRGRHANENTVGRPQVERMVERLDGGYNTAQYLNGADTRYSFRLAGVTFTTNDSWYHAPQNSAADHDSKDALHRGSSQALNIWLSRPTAQGAPVLGYARFPWQFASRPRWDGVTINIDSLPGGAAQGYNQGDTVIHETGHWIGLFHTFEGGCSGGDLVDDTAAEGQPSFYCQRGRDTCPTISGVDPVINFMDYSYDSCMRLFSRGQVRRMDYAFLKWRLQ